MCLSLLHKQNENHKTQSSYYEYINKICQYGNHVKLRLDIPTFHSSEHKTANFFVLNQAKEVAYFESLFFFSTDQPNLPILSPNPK